MTDNNAKHPDSTLKVEYPYNQAMVTRGGHEFHINDTPGNESLRWSHTTGSYIEIDKTGRMVQAVVDKTFQYHADGVSTTSDGHSDSKVSGSSRQNTDGSKSSETGAAQYSGGGGPVVSGSQDSAMHSSAGGDHFQTTSGDVTTSHDGSIHHDYNGDYITHVTGHRADIHQGDWAISSQGGGIDIQIDDGKFRLFDSSDILIESVTNITLKVGKSRIIITPTGINIIASAVNITKA